MAINFPSGVANGTISGNYTYDSSIPGWRKTPENAASLPAGTIVQWPGATAPANWLLCQGQAVSRTTYASLFAAIGVQYGSGDGTTTFNLPNLQGRVAVGLDSSQTEFDTLGETGGAKTHTLTTAEMPSHTHIQDSHNHTQNAHSHTAGDNGHTHPVWGNSGSGVADGGNSNYPNILNRNGTSGTGYASIYVNSATATNIATTATNQNTGGGGAHNNLQPYIVLNYIIKTSAGITSSDSELATRIAAVENKFNTGQNEAPAGAITQFVGATIPANWLLCDGSAVSRTTWPALFSAIGTTYGIGDGTTTFNLPDIPNGDSAGIVSSVRITSSLYVTSTRSDLAGVTSTVSLKAGRTYRISFLDANVNQPTTSRVNLRFLVNGTVIDQTYSAFSGGIGGISLNSQTFYTPSVAGSYTIKCDAALDSGSGTISLYADLSSYISFVIEDMGLVGGSSLRPRNIIKATSGASTNDSTFVTRLSTLESNSISTNMLGLVPVVPTSVNVGAGSATIDSKGRVTATSIGGTYLRLNGVFTDAYKDYSIYISGVCSGTDDWFDIRFSINGTDTNSGYYFGGSYAHTSGTGWSTGADNIDRARLTYIPNAGSMNAIVDVMNARNSAYETKYFARGQYYTTATYYSGKQVTASNVYDGFRLFALAGNISSLVVQVYGYR